MTLETISDFKSFFNPNEHGTTASWTPTGGGGPYSINGIFGNDYFEVQSELVGVASAKPTFLCADSDIVGIGQEDGLVVKSTSYTIANIEPDGTGMTLLILEKV